MEVRQAKRKMAKLKIGLQGPSGSGKTYSALLLAFGITNDWSKIIVIDTENNSADLYSHLGEYKVLTLDAPYSPERYIQAIELAESSFVANVASKNSATNATNETGVIIIDSMSQEWEGTGGILEIHNEMTGNSFTNWGKLTPRHNSLINKILLSKCHIICTIRSKQDYVLSERNGKMIPEKIGLKGVTREGLDYELTLVFELNVKNYASSTKDRTGLFTGKPEFKINAIIGKKLAEWSLNSSNPNEVKELINSTQSLEELIDIYNSYPDIRDSLKQDFVNKKLSFIPPKNN
jgi:hypothetical protein